MTNSILLENVNSEVLFQTFRDIVRTEIANIQPKNETKYLTRKQVCEKFHFSLPTLHAYSKRGLLKSKRIGSRVLYLEDDIQAALKDIPARRR
jgi:hypothetical protein